MKFHRLSWPLFALALFGALVGFFISTVSPFSNFFGAVAKDELRASDLAAQVDSDFPLRSSDQAGTRDLAYPSKVIPGELVVHFDNRNDYLAYLEALTNAGIAPLGQIDKLLAVRIPESALLQTNVLYKTSAHSPS